VSARLSADARRILAAQALRAFGYGATAVLLGVSLDERGLSSVESGIVLTAVLAGTVVTSVTIGRYGDRFGRRRCYLVLYGLLAVAGAVFASTDAVWLLVLAALAGALSTDVVESGPFTSLEQAMLARELDGRELVRGLGIYNAVATASGSCGALAIGGLGRAGTVGRGWFWLLLPVAIAGALAGSSLSAHVEAIRDHSDADVAVGLGGSRPRVARLAALFALDSFGGGFVVQSFVAYWLRSRFDASIATIGVTFFAVGVIQTLSFLIAPRVARRIGLLPTMVFTHLPSNLLLVAIAFAPNLSTAVALLLCRTALSVMDVPARQAYVMQVVEPSERVAAAAYTNTARYVARPAGPVLAGAAQSIAFGAPFAIAGAIKIIYDIVLWRSFARVEAGSDDRDGLHQKGTPA
jgi:MFS family permease